MVDLSIIIVSYNTKEFLKNCIKSIADNIDGLKVEIIIVDNASKDGTVGEIQNSKFKIQNYNLKFKMIENKNNLGFSKANNIGVKNSNGKYLLFLNPDTIVKKSTLTRMVNFMNQYKDAGAATCKIELPNGDLDDASHRGFPTPWRAFCHFTGISKIFPNSQFFNGYHLGWKDLDKVHSIDSAAGAFMIVEREAGEKISWWDEDFFWYGDDLDFCYRLREKGWKVYFVPDCSILHYKGVSGGIKDSSQHLTTANKETKIRATKARFEAMEIFYKKHYIKNYNTIVTWFIFKIIHLKLFLSLRNY